MTDFLPKGYEIPSSGNYYMKFDEQGEHRFRILSPPILGNEGWLDKKPVRKKMDESFEVSEVEDPSKIRHFWAMVVWNYKAGRIQILEITQKTILKALKTLADDPDWGNPVGNNGYDIVVMKTGDGMDTEYQTNPKPKKKLDPDILKELKETKINLEALFTGADPFADSKAATEELTEEQTDEVENMPF